MLLGKYTKLFRKFLGCAVRRKESLPGNIVKAAKLCYLLISGGMEIAGDIAFIAKKRNRPASSHPSRILIVKTDQLGDVLFSTLLVAPIKQRFPNAEIDYLVRPQSEQILLSNPDIHRIHHWHNLILELLPGRGNRKDLLRKLKANAVTRRALKENHYDIVINARAYPPSSNFFLRGLAKRLIAFDIAEQSFLADDWANYDLAAEEWSNFTNLLKLVDIDPSTVGKAGRFFNLHPSNPLQSNRDYLVLSPVTFDKDRQWKIEYWSELIEDLASRGLSIALTGLPSQREYLTDLVHRVADTTGDVHIFVDLTLPEFGTLMDKARLFIGVDSFPAHLALALGKPVRLLINSEAYYVKGLSRDRFAHEARSMIAMTPHTSFFDVESTCPAEVIASC